MKTREAKTSVKLLKGFGKRVRKYHQYYCNKAKSTYICNVCGFKALVRKQAGIWTCKKCQCMCAGKAYTPL